MFYINLSEVAHYCYEIGKSLGSKFKGKVGDDAVLLQQAGFHHIALIRCHGENTFLHVANPRRPASTRQTCSQSSVKCDVGHGARKENGKWYLFLVGLESEIFYSMLKDRAEFGNTLI